MARMILGSWLLLVITLAHAGPAATSTESPEMPLGAFSVSLAVKDIGASRAFYEKLGFRAVMGDPAARWLILRNGTTTIGLFEGLFERNTLTFNPGWDAQANPLAEFRDVRDLQRELQRRGLTPVTAADAASTGPASMLLIDPDGNPVLIDQHVPSPAGASVPAPTR